MSARLLLLAGRVRRACGVPGCTKAALLSGSATEQAMRDWLAASEPDVRKAVEALWAKQGGRSLVQVMEAAVAQGGLPPEVVDLWREDYARLVVEVIEPTTVVGATLAHRQIVAALGVALPLEDFRAALDTWLEGHAAELVAGFTDVQREALADVLRHYIVESPRSGAQLARIIRPMIGLDTRQAGAVLRLRRELEATPNISPQEVDRQAKAYAARLQRVRAERIARTEMATAFNQGHLATVQAGVDSGLIVDEIQREWLTAEDERVCPVCNPLNGVVVAFDEPFPNGAEMAPPLHPGCRCTVLYNVVE